MALMELDSPALNPPPLEHPAGVSLRGLHKSFGRHVALAGVDLDIRPGEFVAVVGPSGCGKSTLLRLIAGLEEPTAGEVWIGGRLATDIPAHQRDIAMVFQAYALYPHLTVYRNLATSLELRRLPRAEVEQRVEAAAAQLDIAYLLNRRPGPLSGGQRQRVALARALVRNPALFLLDEPLSNVDAAQRTSLRREISRLHHALGATFVHVTHDLAEAMMLADRVAVMKAGRIEQIAPPQQLREAPATPFVADFIGAATSLAAAMDRARHNERTGRSLQ